MTSSYPWYTPYQFAGNSPIANIDIDGLENLFYSLSINDSGESELKLVNRWDGVLCNCSGLNVHVSYKGKNLRVAGNLFKNRWDRAAGVLDGYRGKSEEYLDNYFGSQEAYSSDYDRIHNEMNERIDEYSQYYRGGRGWRPKATKGSSVQAPDVPKEKNVTKSKKSTVTNNIVTNPSSRLGGRELIVDENLSPRISQGLKEQGFNVKVFDKGTLDPSIIKHAQKNGSIVLTNNIKDFKKQGITTIKVSERLKHGSNVNELINRIKSIDAKSTTNPSMITPGRNISAAADEFKN